MVHIELFIKINPVNGMLCWNIFMIFMYKSKMNYKLELYVCVEIKSGTNKLIL